jgi:hypothetical protein
MAPDSPAQGGHQSYELEINHVRLEYAMPSEKVAAREILNSKFVPALRGTTVRPLMGNHH